MSTKQVIVIRKDLNLRRGKECSQASHSSIAFLTSRLKETGRKDEFVLKLHQAERDWLVSGTTKITLQVNSEKELLDVYQRAKAAGLETHLIRDAGKTELKEPTLTCCSIGPDYAERIDPITKTLELY